MYVACASKYGGKTHLVREYLVPTLAETPAALEPYSPPGGYRVVLISDPRRAIDGAAQYTGTRYHDVQDFRRASKKAFVACFDNANQMELLRLAVECKGAIVVFDELDKAFHARRTLHPFERELLNQSRHYGVAVVGTCRRLHAVHVEFRNNVQGMYIGAIPAQDDRDAAQEIISASPEQMAELAFFLQHNQSDSDENNRALIPPKYAFGRLPRRHFVEWNQDVSDLSLITLAGSSKKVVARF